MPRKKISSRLLSKSLPREFRHSLQWSDSGSSAIRWEVNLPPSWMKRRWLYEFTIQIGVFQFHYRLAIIHNDFFLRNWNILFRCYFVCWHRNSLICRDIGETSEDLRRAGICCCKFLWHGKFTDAESNHTFIDILVRCWRSFVMS